MLDTPQKKILAACASLFFLISAAALNGLLPFSSRTQMQADAGGTHADAFTRKRRGHSFDAFMRIVRSKRQNSTAARFSARFMAKPALRGSWNRLQKTKDLKAFSEDMNRSKDFQDVVAEFAGDAGFRKLYATVADRPPFTDMLDAFASKGGSSASGGGLGLVRGGLGPKVKDLGLNRSQRRSAGKLMARGMSLSGACARLGGCRGFGGRRGGRAGQSIQGRRVRDISSPDIGGGSFVSSTQFGYDDAGNSGESQGDADAIEGGGENLDGTGVDEQGGDGPRGTLPGSDSGDGGRGDSGGGSGGFGADLDGQNQLVDPGTDPPPDFECTDICICPPPGMPAYKWEQICGGPPGGNPGGPGGWGDSDPPM